MATYTPRKHDEKKVIAGIRHADTGSSVDAAILRRALVLRRSSMSS